MYQNLMLEIYLGLTIYVTKTLDGPRLIETDKSFSPYTV